jgi:hypothetical protein
LTISPGDEILDGRARLATGGSVSLAGDEQKTLRGRIFLEDRQATAGVNGLAGLQFDFRQREPGLELGADEVELSRLGKDGVETLCGCDGFPCRGADSGYRD